MLEPLRFWLAESVCRPEGQIMVPPHQHYCPRRGHGLPCALLTLRMASVNHINITVQDEGIDVVWVDRTHPQGEQVPVRDTEKPLFPVQTHCAGA